MDSNKIGKFIYTLRTEKHLSQYQLADLIPISRQAVSKWERGVTIPDSSTLICLSKIFNVTINELLNGKREPKEDLQTTTLSIVDESNRKTKTIKRTITASVIIITTLLVAFLSYYFISSYNTTEVYKLGNDNGKFIMTDGILIKAREKLYIRLGNIKANEEVEIKEIEYYYIKDKKEKLIIKDQDAQNLIVMDNKGYNEKNLLKDINLIKNNSYLRITYNDNQVDTMKIRYVKDFTNDEFFIKEKINYAKTTDVIVTPDKEEKKEEEPPQEPKEESVVEDKPKVEEQKPVSQPTIKEEPEKPKEENKEIPKTNEIIVNYETIVNKIIEKGELVEGTYSYEYSDDNYSIEFYYFKSLNQISMEDSNEDTWTYMVQAGIFICDSVPNEAACNEKVKEDVLKYLFN